MTLTGNIVGWEACLMKLWLLVQISPLASLEGKTYKKEDISCLRGRKKRGSEQWQWFEPECLSLPLFLSRLLYWDCPFFLEACFWFFFFFFFGFPFMVLVYLSWSLQIYGGGWELDFETFSFFLLWCWFFLTILFNRFGILSELFFLIESASPLCGLWTTKMTSKDLIKFRLVPYGSLCILLFFHIFSFFLFIYLFFCFWV